MLTKNNNVINIIKEIVFIIFIFIVAAEISGIIFRTGKYLGTFIREMYKIVVSNY